MTIENVGVVDYVFPEEGTGHIVLVALDDLDWSDEGSHIRMLQEKLNAYLRFIESGEVFDEVFRLTGAEVAKTTPVKVQVLARIALSPKGQHFIQYASRMFDEAGFALEHRIVVPGAAKNLELS